MGRIGGNISGVIQVESGKEKNEIGELVTAWTDKYIGVRGWLGLQSGDSKYSYNAKIEESSHVFLCDYHSGIYALSLPDEKTKRVPDCRMIIKNVVYDILLIDNPDEMNEQLEIYLRRVGAWNGRI